MFPGYLAKFLLRSIQVYLEFYFCASTGAIQFSFSKYWLTIGLIKWRHILKNTARIKVKDVCAHCYCASLVRTLSIGHARVTSFSRARTDSKTRQNIERMTFVLTWCANIFVGCSVTPTFFRQITFFSDSLHHTKKQNKSVCGKF